MNSGEEYGSVYLFYVHFLSNSDNNLHPSIHF